MIFNPILHPIILGIFALLLIAAVVWQAKLGTKFNWFAIARRSIMVLLLFAIALRPGLTQGEANAVKMSQELDIFLVIDTTGSMIAEDISQDMTRMDLVRADIEKLIAEYPGAKFAIITFDSTAVQAVPLTSDLGAIVSALEVMRPETTLYSNGSSISEAKDLLLHRLQADKNTNPERSRAVFYFGDGEQTATSMPESFSDSASYIAGGAVFGYGTSGGGKMRETKGYFYNLDSDDEKPEENEYIKAGGYGGKDAISRIDEVQLKNIANQLGVSYHHRSLSADVPKIPVQLPQGLKVVEGGTTQVAEEIYYYFAIALVPFVALEAFVLLNALIATRQLVRRARK